MEQIKYLPKEIKNSLESSEFKNPNLSVITDGLDFASSGQRPRTDKVHGSEPVSTSQESSFKKQKSLNNARSRSGSSSRKSVRNDHSVLLPEENNRSYLPLTRPRVDNALSDPESSDNINHILFNLHKIVYSCRVISWGTIAPIVILLLPNLISAVPDAVNGINKIITGSGVTDKREEVIKAINLLEENGFTVLTKKFL